jgi:hypothetical protein
MGRYTLLFLDTYVVDTGATGSKSSIIGTRHQHTAQYNTEQPVAKMEEEDRRPAGGAEEDRKPAAKKQKKISKNSSASAQKEEDPIDWRRKCIEKFHLQELPESCEDSKLISLSKSDDSTWKRYYKFRSLLQQVTKESDEDEDPEGEIGLLREFRDHMEEVAGEISCSWWKKHVMQTILDLCWEDEDLRTIEAQATIFSPLAIPHALRFQHRHHHRTRQSTVEFYCYWHFQLLRFDGKPIQSKSDAQVSIGDYVTLNHAQTFFKDLDDYGLKGSQSYLADNQMELLCNNGFLECPNVQEGPNGDSLWEAVQDIDVHNFTPTTVHRMRHWLRIADPSVLGRKADKKKPLLQLPNTFGFLRLLFASVGGADDFGTRKTGGASPGYTWFPNSDFLSHYDLTEHVSINWLDYQARLVSGALRPFDIYYQPYDPWKHKADWGERLLEAWDCDDEAEEKLKKLLEADETTEDIINAPKWVLWERAEKSASQGLPKAMLAQMMGLLMTNR